MFTARKELWLNVRDAIFSSYVHSSLRLFSSDAFFYVCLRTCAQYASMNEFTCSEHSVRIRRSKKTQHWKSTFAVGVR